MEVTAQLSVAVGAAKVVRVEDAYVGILAVEAGLKPFSLWLERRIVYVTPSPTSSRAAWISCICLFTSSV